MQPDTDFKRVRFAFIEKSSERNLEIFNIETIKVLDTVLHLHPEYETLTGLSSVRTQALLDLTRQLSLLATTPFSLFSPVFNDIQSWEALVANWPSESVVKVKDQAPRHVGTAQLYQIRHANQLYLHLIREFSANYVLAPAIFGMSREVMTFLGNLSASSEIDLLYNIGPVPLFKWRMGTPRFWFDHTTGALTRERIAHFIMEVSPAENKISNLPRKADWDAYGFKKTLVEDYMDALLAYGFRAASVSKIMRRTPAEVRNRFKSIHGKASICGSAPKSLSWIISSAKNRLHATFFTYLYRNANTESSRAYLPFLATLNLYEKMFSVSEKGQYLTVDRAFHMLRMMANDSSMNVGACKRCTTQYLISNSSEKIELAESYSCPFCSQRHIGRANTPSAASA
jgi:DNA-directed RNA polymerase subunit RPC12/RpoP